MKKMKDPLRKTFLDDEEELEEKEKSGAGELEEEKKKIGWQAILIPLGIFILALSVRLVFLFANDPQSAGLAWYGDVYHHWQIAYLSKEIGFGQGFLRLWDLKGMEYYWGLMHPLVLSTLFTLTRSVDILIPRLLSVICGSLVAAFIYLLLKRYFNQITAIAGGVWTALFSVVLFSDTLGMQEQLGLALLFGGMLVWPKRALLAGVLWSLASMVRSEYWLFAAALTFAAVFSPDKKTNEKKLLLLLGYLAPIILYMKYMLNYTGNPIFPIWWNYLASVVGKWFSNVSQPLEPGQIGAQWIGRGLFLLGFLGVLGSFIKKPKSYLFFLLGFSNITLIGFIFGFAAYVHGFFDRFWVDRLFAFPYLFLGILIITLFLGVLPNLLPKMRIPLSALGLIIFLSILLGSQLAWGKIMYYFKMAQAPYPAEVKLASLIAKHDMEGKYLFPSDRPALTYNLVRNHQISGERLISEMYDPFYYAKEGESPEEIEKKVFDWFAKEDIKLVVYSGKSQYRDLIKKYPGKFKQIDASAGAIIYEFLQ